MLSIAISLSPNTEPEDVRRAASLVLKPWRYGEGSSKQATDSRYKIEDEFRAYFNVPFARSFNSGRSALYILLKAFGIGAGDEILLQAFTCNAVPNPVLWVGAHPVYIDIERDTYNIDPADLEKKITPRAKVLIIQHTFGISADLERILPIARKHGLFVIEDCAHALGGMYGSRKQVAATKQEVLPLSDGAEATEAGSRHEGVGDQKHTSYQLPATSYGKIGTFGDAAFFSFGRDKVISSVYGGMVVTKDADLAKKVDAEHARLPFPSRFWVFQQLLHPIVFAIALPLYEIGIGKFIIWCAQKLRLLSKAVTLKERTGGKPEYFPKRLPEALANLALSQFKRLETFNARRREIAAYYFDQLSTTNYQLPTTRSARAVWLRFPIEHPRAPEIIAAARREGIYLGDWYREVIAPARTNLERMRYQPGSCPVAEDAAKRIINLPTYPRLTVSQTKEVVDLLLRFFERGIGGEA